MRATKQVRQSYLVEKEASSSFEKGAEPRIATTRPFVRDFASDAEKLLTVRELAELFKVPVSWVYEHARTRRTDRLPHLKLGKYLRFEEQAVREFLERQRRT